MNYNLILYIGLFLIVGSFVVFLLYEMHKRKLDVEQFKQQQLSKSFKPQLIPMTEEEEYRTAGITKEEINKKRKNPGIEKNKNKALPLPLLKNL